MKMFCEMSYSTKCKESDKCGRPKSPKNQTVETALAPDRETALDVFLMSTALHTSVAMSAVYVVIGTIPQHRHNHHHHHSGTQSKSSNKAIFIRRWTSNIVIFLIEF